MYMLFVNQILAITKPLGHVECGKLGEDLALVGRRKGLEGWNRKGLECDDLGTQHSFVGWHILIFQENGADHCRDIQGFCF